MVYLGVTKDLWLTFGRQSQKLIEGFCDSDYANQRDCHSIAGFAYHFRQGVISWSSKKQQVIALSTVEAEYIAQAHAVKEALWLCLFVSKIPNELAQAIMINSDNQGAIALSKDNKFHSQTKHINIQYHFICEAVEDVKVSVVYIPTDENPADIFTKPLAKGKFQKFVELLGLQAINENVGSKKEHAK
jgi:phosphopantetheinyl transferase (holo-ACP synthase)